jgi:hypothetical protein
VRNRYAPFWPHENSGQVVARTPEHGFERVPGIASLDDHHPICHEVERMGPIESGRGVYRLTFSAAEEVHHGV